MIKNTHESTRLSDLLVAGVSEGKNPSRWPLQDPGRGWGAISAYADDSKLSLTKRSRDLLITISATASVWGLRLWDGNRGSRVKICQEKCPREKITDIR
jgi:hypothetical protein